MRYLSPKLIVVFGFCVLFAAGISAQADPPPPKDVAQFENEDRRPNLLENLGLTQDQVRQIRLMNRDRKPLMEAAQRRLREANRALDMSIYGDDLNENLVQERLREFQSAQAEVAQIRFQSELELRKILTPEQLVRFRSLRALVAETRKNRQQRRQLPPRERPLQRLRQLPNRQPGN